MGITDVFDDINFYIPKESKIHPTEKPLKLIDRLLIACSNEQDVILDPFMGSGSLAISCINNNRNFIGAEIDENYFELANKKILKI
jgi:DNA modification methylase